MTRSTRQVLEALLAHPEQERYGYNLGKETGVAHGTVYEVLTRLESWGWLESWIEQPTDGAGPGRRNYRLTGNGTTCAAAALAHADRARPRRRLLRPVVEMP